MKQLCHILFILHVFFASAQDPMHLIYDDGNGCYDFEQYDLIQDRKGYIWIAGNSGCFQYNARNFIHYESSESPGRALTCLREDLYGRMWMNDFAGNVFYITQRKLKRFTKWNAHKSASFPVMETAGSHLWLVAEDGISEYYLDQQARNIHLRKHQPVSTSRVTCLYKGQLYVTGLNDVLCVEKKLRRFPIEGTHKPDFLRAWSTLFQLKGELYLFVRDENALYKFNGSAFRLITRFSGIGDFISFKVIDNTGWILTRNGLIRLNDAFEIQERLFAGVACSDLMKDNQGNYWLSTLNKGVILIPDPETRVFGSTLRAGFSKLVVHGNQLLAGTNDGVLYLLKDNALQPVFTETQQKEIGFLYHNPFSSELYAGAFDVYRISGNRTESLGTNPSVKQMQFLSPELSLIADPGGLYFRTWNNSPIGKDAIPSYLHPYLTELQNGNGPAALQLVNYRTSRFSLSDEGLLAATKNGLLLFSKRGKSFQYFDGKPIYATDFEHTPEGLLVATSNLGLLHLTNGKWKRIRPGKENEQLRYIQHVCYDNRQVWLATDAGILYIHLPSGRHRIIDQSNGLLTTRISDMLIFDGYLYVSTTKGLLRFRTDSQEKKLPVPPFYLSGINTDGKFKEPSTHINVASNPGVVTLHFDALWYSNTTRMFLRYRSDNDPKWIALSPGIMQINLNKPGPGAHQIHVELADYVSGKTLRTYTQSFYVQPTFLQYTWVRITIACVILILGIFSVYRYILTLRRKNSELIEKERLQRELKQSMLSAIKAQMNPHFIFNALNTIQSYILTNDRMQANFYLGKFSDLMRRILNMSNQDSIPIEEEEEALRLYLELENMRLHNELIVTLDFEGATDIMHKKIPSMIVQPYVENAIKHGLLHFQGEKKLHITFRELSGNLLEVIITDYGIGRAASYKMKQRSVNRHKSFSTEANKKRLELLNEQHHQDISVEITDADPTANATGTRVVLRIPFQ